jgi:hypothetical protein
VTTSLQTLAALALVSCTSSTPDPAGGSSTGGAPGTGGGGSDSGGSAGHGGAGIAGSSGGSPTGGASNGGAAGTAGVTTSGGSGGSNESGGSAGSSAGSGGTATAGAASAGTSGAGGAGSGGGGSGGGAGTLFGGAGGAGGAGAGGGGALGCDWTNTDGRIVLFDGTSLSTFRNATTKGVAHWRLVGDGTFEVVPMNPSTNLETSMGFEDLCLHLEYMTPMYAANVTGQQRGNSGVYFKGSYEMQVLDTYGQPPAIDGCGAIYGISEPLVVACNMQLVWNTYEIEFRGSRWNASGTKTDSAVFVKATLNGRVVQENVELDVSSTTAGLPDERGPRPLALQDHGNAVRYRNIWAKVPRY